MVLDPSPPPLHSIPRAEWRGLTAFARCNKACVFRKICHFVLEFAIFPKYSGTLIIARNSHTNRLTSEDTEYNLSVYSVSTSNFKPSPSTRGPSVPYVALQHTATHCNKPLPSYYPVCQTRLWGGYGQ